MSSRWRAAVPLAGIVALAAALRIVGIGFGLPDPHARPDEQLAVDYAASIAAGDPNPHFFHWPSLTLYLFAAAFAAARAAGSGLSDEGRVLVARAIVAAAGTGTVLAA